MAAEAGLAQRPEQIPERLVSEKVEALVGDLKSRLLLRVADLASDAGAIRGIMGLVNADVVLLLHALDELLDQFFE